MDHLRPKFSPRLIVFSALYMVIAIMAAISQGNTEFVFYIVVMVVLITSLIVVHQRVNFSDGVLWGMSCWGLMHMSGGLVRVPEALTQNGTQPVLYSWWIIRDWLKYDQIVHAYGFGITTWACWQILKSNIKKQTGKTPQASYGLCVLSAAGGMGFGALNEVVEFIATLTIPETNVGDYNNTGWDLVYNLLGCGLVAILIRQYDNHRSE